MTCAYCGGVVTLRRQIASNGAKTVVQKCAKRERPPAGRTFLPMSAAADWESLPLENDYREQAEPCCVKGCNETHETEWRHFAPRHLFPDAEKWPMGTLCARHHQQWHRLTRTGSFYYLAPSRKEAS